MSNNLDQEYILATSNDDIKQIIARAELNKGQPVLLRVIALISAILIMSYLQIDQSVNSMTTAVITMSFALCLQLAVDNWHTRKKLNAVIVLLQTEHRIMNK
jgi:hypothetical protein